MRNNKNAIDVQIHFKDMFWYVLSSWKSIIIFFLLGIILAEGYSYYKTKKNEKSIDYASLEQNEEIMKMMDLNGQYKEAQETLKDSYIAKIDTSDIYTIVAKFYVTDCVASSDYKEDLLTIYSDMVFDDDIKNFVKTKISDSIPENEINEFVSSTINGHSLVITIKSSDKKTSEEMLEFVTDLMNSSVDDLSDQIGTHKIQLISKTIAIGKNEWIDNYKSTIINNVNDLKTQCENAYNKLNEIQKKYIDCDGKLQIQTQKFDVFNVKRIGLGGVAGVVIITVILCFVYAVSRKIRTHKDVEEMYGVNEISTLYGYRKGNARGISKHIYYGRYSLHKKDNIEEQVGIVNVKINLLCQKAAVSNIGIISMGEEDALSKLLNTDVNINFCKNVNTDEEIKQIYKDDAVILIVEIGRTKYNQVEDTIKLLELLGQNILGYIALV